MWNPFGDSEPKKKKSNVPEEDRKYITGADVTYTVPEYTNEVKIKIVDKNGTQKGEYTLTDYLDIDPNDKVRIIIE